MSLHNIFIVLSRHIETVVLLSYNTNIGGNDEFISN